MLVATLATSAFALQPGCGDGNASGTTTASDALLTLKKAVGQSVTCPACACDVNADTRTTSADALAILRRSVGSASYLACFADAACRASQPVLGSFVASPVAPGSLLRLSMTGVDPSRSHRVRLFGTGLSVEIPAAAAGTGSIAAVMPPLGASALPLGVAAASATTVKVQVLEGDAPNMEASAVLAGLQIPAQASAPLPIGKVTRVFLAAWIQRGQQELTTLQANANPAWSDVETGVGNVVSALTTLDGLVASAVAGTPAAMGTFGGQPLVLTADDVAQVDAMLMAHLRARADQDDSALLTATTLASLLSGNCGQSQADTLWNDLKNGQPTTSSGSGYASAPCVAEAFDTGYAVVGGCAALATGVLALAGAPAIALALPAAAVLYVTIEGSGGLMMVGAALAQSGADGVALIQQGVKMAESTMRSMLKGQVLPEEAGTVLEMTEASSDLSGAFTAMPPTPPTTTTTTTTSTSTTQEPGVGCYCCCAFWEGVNHPFHCLESAQPQQPSNGEIAVCSYYSADIGLCGTGFCEN